MKECSFRVYGVMANYFSGVVLRMAPATNNIKTGWDIDY